MKYRLLISMSFPDGSVDNTSWMTMADSDAEAQGRLEILKAEIEGKSIVPAGCMVKIELQKQAP